MSRVMSFRDLLLIEGLSKYRELDLLHPSMDDKVKFYLDQLGFNIDAPVEYIPNKHRDIRGVVAVGFRAVGTIATGHPFLRSRLATIEDRIMATYFSDPSLAIELSQMLGRGISFSDDDLLPADDEEEFPPELIEPDYEEVAAELKRLEELRDNIRGPMYNIAGSPKTYKEYAEYVVPA